MGAHTLDRAMFAILGFVAGAGVVISVADPAIARWRQGQKDWQQYAESFAPRPLDVSGLISTGDYVLSLAGENPPAEYQGDVRAVIEFVAADKVSDRCGTAAMACGGNPAVMPNPCRFNKDDPYARLLCHELGHVNGWSHAPSPFIRCEGPFSKEGKAECLKGIPAPKKGGADG